MLCSLFLLHLQSGWQYAAQSVDNPELEARTSITVDTMLAPVPVNDVITLSTSLIERSQEVELGTLLNNDFDPNTRLPNTLPLKIESASCVGRSQCTIEDGTLIRIKLRGFEVSGCWHRSMTQIVTDAPGTAS
jgi:hypothetical protein